MTARQSLPGLPLNKIRPMKPKSQKGQPPVGSKKDKRCETKWCRNQKPLRPNGYLLKHCWKCQSRKLKKSQPETYVLNMIRHSARKRKIACTLTVDEFKWFCLRTGYLEKRGSKPSSLTVDRIDHRLGYHIENLKVSTHAVNSRAGYCYPGGQVHQNHRRADSEPF